MEQLKNISAWFAQLLVRSPHVYGSKSRDTSFVTDHPPDCKPTDLNFFLKVTKLSSQNYAFYQKIKRVRRCTYNAILRGRSHRHCSPGKQYYIFWLYVCSLIHRARNAYAPYYTGWFIIPSGISEIDSATTKTDTAERSISIDRESLQVFFNTRRRGVLARFTASGAVVTKHGVDRE
jgi:hypothetical protein